MTADGPRRSVSRILRMLDRRVAPALARVVANRHGIDLARIAAALSLPFTWRGSVGVVIVNWNTLSFLRETLEALRRFSETPLEVLVVDNGSTDGSVEFLKASPDLRRICLASNVGHAAAMDLGFLFSASEIVLSLDVDAFPIRKSWLETIVSPLDAGSTVSGVRLWRPYAHPCCMAMRKSRFVLRRHTFRSRYSSDREKLGRTAWDVGESISMRESRRGGAVHLVPVTSQRGPGDVGSVFGEILYHNFYAARHKAGREGAIDGVFADDAARAWEEAVRAYLRG